MKRGSVRCTTMAALHIAMDTEVIQHPLPFRNLYLSRNPCDNLTVLDVETPYLDNRCEILQVATCLFSNPDVSFSIYILSTRQLSRDAIAVTYISLGRASGRNVLLRKSIKVLVVCWSVAEEFFPDWPGKIATSPSTLVAHN